MLPLSLFIQCLILFCLVWGCLFCFVYFFLFVLICFLIGKFSSNCDIYMYRRLTETHIHFKEKKSRKSQTIVITHMPRQNVFAWLQSLTFIFTIQTEPSSYILDSANIQNFVINISFIFFILLPPMASFVAQLVKNQPAMQETWVPLLGGEDPTEKGKTIHSSILAWRFPWTV